MPIARYINHRTPFGPIDASVVRAADKSVLVELFDRNNAIYDALRRQPPIVMGRKGSGKTSYLRSAYLDSGYTEVVELKTAETFIKVIRAIEETVKSSYFVEAIAELWGTLLNCAVFAHLTHKYGKQSREVELIQDYLSKIGVRQELTIDDVLWTIVDTLADRLKASPYGLVAEVLRKTAGVSFAEARDAAARFLDHRNKRVIILLDSLDEYCLDTDAVSRSLAGLLMCVGRFSAMEDRVDIRFCLPSELYHRFMQVCASPAKTFQNTLLLTWHARELIAIGAHRLKVYLREFHAEFFDHARIARLNPESHSDAKEIFHSVLPRKVRNKLGRGGHARLLAAPHAAPAAPLLNASE